jgi:DHA2 family methylenomycin A resistance protein-like MFS transporter
MIQVVSAPTRPASDRVVSAALVAICLAYFMVILDSTIVNVALPALRSDLGSSLSGLQWVVDGYLLVLAALLLTGGTLADRLGARRVFQVGLGGFVLASLGCGLAPNIPVLVGARLVQGIGAALAVPASLALLRAAYPDSTTRARAIGVWGGIAGGAAASGPILGGLLVAAVNWRLVFFVNVPIGLASMLLTARYVPNPDRRPRALDLPAQLVEALALTGLTFALIEGGRDGLTPAVVASATAFVVGLVAFVAIERAVAHPMLPLGMFGHRMFSTGNTVGLLINLGFYGELFVINLYFQQVRGYSALVAGLALLPQMGMAMLGSALSGRFTSRVGSPRPTMLIGLVCGGVGLLALTITGAHTAYPVLVAPLVLAGLGMSFTMPAVTTAVVESVPVERSGLAAGAINAARQIGSVIGVALLGSLVGTGSSLSGLRVALVIGAAAFLAGALLVATATRREAADG